MSQRAVEVASHLPAAPLEVLPPPGSAPSSLPLLTFCPQRACLAASPGLGEELQSVPTSFRSGFKPLSPASQAEQRGTSLLTQCEGRRRQRAHDCQAVCSRHSVGSRPWDALGLGCPQGDGWEPQARWKADADTSGVSHPEGKCSVSCLRR